MRFVLKLLLVLFPIVASAAGLAPDPTGLWYKPDESGWGASVLQQGETLFVVLFVYDDARKPAWFVASDVRDRGDGKPSGTLYRTSGPPFAANFDASSVTLQSAGTLSVNYATGADPGSQLTLDYTIDGVRVTKTIQRQTWASNENLLAGTYVGGIVASQVSANPISCPDLGGFFPFGDEVKVDIPSPGQMRFSRFCCTDVINALEGSYVQRGQLGEFSGDVFLNALIFQSPSGTARISNIVASGSGFSGNISFVRDGCAYIGTIGGIRKR